MISHFEMCPVRKPRQDGFTLLELLVTLAIVGLALAIAAPRISSSAARFSASRTAGDIAAALRLARADAILRNVEAKFVIDVDSRYFEIAGKGDRTSFDDDLDVDVIAAKTELIAAAAPGIRFWPDGSSTGGRIVLSQGARRYEILVDWLTGAVSVEEMEASDAPN